MWIIKEIWQYIRERKKYWLIPVILILILLGLLIIFGGDSALASFMYTIF